MYYCSNCHPDKVVHAGHGNLALGLLTGLPQHPGDNILFLHFISCHTQVAAVFNAIKGFATKCCSSAYGHLCNYADALAQL